MGDTVGVRVAVMLRVPVLERVALADLVALADMVAVRELEAEPVAVDVVLADEVETGDEVVVEVDKAVLDDEAEPVEVRVPVTVFVDAGEGVVVIDGGFLVMVTVTEGVLVRVFEVVEEAVRVLETLAVPETVGNVVTVGPRGSGERLAETEPVPVRVPLTLGVAVVEPDTVGPTEALAATETVTVVDDDALGVEERDELPLLEAEAERDAEEVDEVLRVGSGEAELEALMAAVEETVLRGELLPVRVTETDAVADVETDSEAPALGDAADEMVGLRVAVPETERDAAIEPVPEGVEAGDALDAAE